MKTLVSMTIQAENGYKMPVIEPEEIQGQQDMAETRAQKCPPLLRDLVKLRVVRTSSEMVVLAHMGSEGV